MVIVIVWQKSQFIFLIKNKKDLQNDFDVDNKLQ